MYRFYFDRKIEGQSISFNDPQRLHHMRHVLRLKPGDEVAIFDAAGSEFICSLTKLDALQAVLAIRSGKLSRAHKIRLAVACAIPKRGGLDEIIDGLTQLGVETIIPMRTERGVVRLDDTAGRAKRERWRRVARSAAEQSARNDIPTITSVTTLKDVIGSAVDYQLKLIPTLVGEKQHLREVIRPFSEGRMIVLIGPEGDFTPEEVELAIKAGFIPVSLGKTTLRVGTAALAVAAFVMLSLE